MEVRSVVTIVRALNNANVEYLIVGGLAVNAHGYSRMTRDVDIVFSLEPSNVIAGLNALVAEGWRLAIPVSITDFAKAEFRERWRREKNMIALKLWSDDHRRTPIDIFVYEPFNFANEYKRAVRLEVISGLVAPVVTRETLLAMKRDANRPQDLIDILELTRLDERNTVS